MLTDSKIKRGREPNLFLSVIISWLGIVNLFQTFDDLESVKDKKVDIQAVRQVIDEDDDAAQNEGAEAVC